MEPLPNRFSMAYKLSVTKYFLSGVILQVLPHVEPSTGVCRVNIYLYPSMEEKVMAS